MDELLTEQDVTILNEARKALHRLSRRASNHPTGDAGRRKAGASDCARLSAYADVAENGLFDVLNIADSYCGAGLTPFQLHEDASSALRSS